MEVLDWQTTDGPYSGQHVIFGFDPSWYFDPSDVQLEWWYTDDYYDSGAWGYAIDNVEIWSPPVIYTDYDQIVNVYCPIGSTVTAYFPVWYPSVAAEMDVQVCTELLIDEDTSNDCIEDLGVLIGFLDAYVDSIDFPQALMGPVPFDPVATVGNGGDFDLRFNQDGGAQIGPFNSINPEGWEGVHVINFLKLENEVDAALAELE